MRKYFSQSSVLAWHYRLPVSMHGSVRVFDRLFYIVTRAYTYIDEVKMRLTLFSWNFRYRRRRRIDDASYIVVVTSARAMTSQRLLEPFGSSSYRCITCYVRMQVDLWTNSCALVLGFAWLYQYRTIWLWCFRLLECVLVSTYTLL